MLKIYSKVRKISQLSIWKFKVHKYLCNNFQDIYYFRVFRKFYSENGKSNLCFIHFYTISIIYSAKVYRLSTSKTLNSDWFQAIWKHSDLDSQHRVARKGDFLDKIVRSQLSDTSTRQVDLAALTKKRIYPPTGAEDNQSFLTVEEISPCHHCKTNAITC